MLYERIFRFESGNFTSNATCFEADRLCFVLYLLTEALAHLWREFNPADV